MSNLDTLTGLVGDASSQHKSLQDDAKKLSEKWEKTGLLEGLDGYDKELANKKMKVNPFVFREYDIRGVVKDDFPPEFVNGLGKAFGTYVKRIGVKEISLSGDVRLSTPEIKKEFKEGVLDTGVDVIDIGILPTPANYFSMWKLEVGASVQITGSHNPADMNGFKMSIDKAAVFGGQIQQLKLLIQNDDFEVGSGTEVKYQLIDEYIEMIQKKIRLERSMKIAIDCGNAAACHAAPQVFSGLDTKVTELFCDVDGQFPNHHPDPTIIENVSEKSLVNHEEIFGPILPIITYDEIDEVVQLINSNPKPLGLYIFSYNRKNINFILNNTSAGGTSINDTILHYMHLNLPFGGINNSGFGRTHGEAGFKAFSNQRSILKQSRLSPMKLLYPPYNNSVKKMIKFLMKYI